MNSSVFEGKVQVEVSISRDKQPFGWPKFDGNRSLDHSDNRSTRSIDRFCQVPMNLTHIFSFEFDHFESLRTVSPFFLYRNPRY